MLWYAKPECLEHHCAAVKRIINTLSSLYLLLSCLGELFKGLEDCNRRLRGYILAKDFNIIYYPMCHWEVTILWLDCQALADLADHATPKYQSCIATFTSQLIYQFKAFFGRIWFANDQLCKRYILIHFWPNLAPNWLRGVALKSRHATWPFCQDTGKQPAK